MIGASARPAGRRRRRARTSPEPAATTTNTANRGVGTPRRRDARAGGGVSADRRSVRQTASGPRRGTAGAFSRRGVRDGRRTRPPTVTGAAVRLVARDERARTGRGCEGRTGCVARIETGSAPARRGSAAREGAVCGLGDGRGRGGASERRRRTDEAGGGATTATGCGCGRGSASMIEGGGAGGGGCGAETGSGDGGGSSAEAWTGGLGGSSPSGSTYPSSSLATRIPRCTCGSGVSASTLVPTLPTVSPSATTRPRSTSSAPSCASVTA